jgi:hypothetical protein
VQLKEFTMYLDVSSLLHSTPFQISLVGDFQRGCRVFRLQSFSVTFVFSIDVSDQHQHSEKIYVPSIPRTTIYGCFSTLWHISYLKSTIC